jgi:hypothetical protein
MCAQVGAVLNDAGQPLFRRYGAMFSLRNRGGEEAVRLLGVALTTDASSALFRHEVAFVLGQMQHPAAIAPLQESLERAEEHSMVRHESAEALGAIEGAQLRVVPLASRCLPPSPMMRAPCGLGCPPRSVCCRRHTTEEPCRGGVGGVGGAGTEEEWARCAKVLRAFIGDADPVVGESCQVALDAADYWQRAEEFGSDGVRGFAELKRRSEKSAVGQEGGGVGEEGAAEVVASCQRVVHPVREHFNITTPQASSSS